MMNKKEEQGKCPKCKGWSLTYGALELQDDLIYYPFTCDDCGHEDNEWYSLTFIGNNT
jgi:hypothetical protein